MACQSANSGPLIPRRDASAGFINHREFKAAAQAAPNLMREMLRTVTQYEAEIAQLEASK